MTRLAFLRLPLAAALLGWLTGCERPSPSPAATVGATLEASARARGLVGDPSSINPTGVYAGETDRACVMPERGDYRIGVSVDYGEGQGCLARGTARGKGSLDVRLGDRCRFTALLDGDRIVFPALLPAACDRGCRGRASLATFSATRLSASASEAGSVPAMDGRALCS